MEKKFFFSFNFLKCTPWLKRTGRQSIPCSRETMSNKTSRTDFDLMSSLSTLPRTIADMIVDYVSFFHPFNRGDRQTRLRIIYDRTFYFRADRNLQEMFGVFEWLTSDTAPTPEEYHGFLSACFERIAVSREEEEREETR